MERKAGQTRRVRSGRWSHDRSRLAALAGRLSEAAKRKSNAGIGAVCVGLVVMCSSFIVNGLYRRSFGYVK